MSIIYFTTPVMRHIRQIRVQTRWMPRHLSYSYSMLYTNHLVSNSSPTTCRDPHYNCDVVALVHKRLFQNISF